MTLMTDLLPCRFRLRNFLKPALAIPFLVAALVLTGAAGPSARAADGDTVMGQSRDWTAVAFEENGDKSCYIVSQAKKSEGDYTKRGPAYVQVTRRADQPAPVVSIQMGYPFKDGAEVSVAIGSDSFAMFTQGETAWAYSDTDDARLIAAMRAGADMRVEGTSVRGTETSDTYSLLGFAKALSMIAESCN